MTKKQERQIRAKERLKDQLKSGVISTQRKVRTPLTELNIKRIKKEISVLESRI